MSWGINFLAAASFALFAPTIDAAEIKIQSSVAVKGLVTELSEQFERATGNKINSKFAAGPAVKRAIDAGVAFDAVVLSPALIDELVNSRKVATGTSTPIARTGIGVAVRRGASKPDLSSVEAFKNALRRAKSIGLTDAALGVAASVYVVKLIERLGMTEVLSSKIKMHPVTAFPKPIVNGEMELWLTQVSEIVQTPSIDLAGPIPAEIQNFTVFTAGISSESTGQLAVRDLLKFFVGPGAAPVLKKMGMEPG